MKVFPNVSSSEVYAENRRGAGPRTRITADTHKQARQQKRPRPIQKDNRNRDSQDNTNKNGYVGQLQNNKNIQDKCKKTTQTKAGKADINQQEKEKISNFNSLVLLVFLTREPNV